MLTYRATIAVRWVNTFSIIAEGHLGLAEANGIFSGTDAIEFFELGLVDALPHMSVKAKQQQHVPIEHVAASLRLQCVPDLGSKSQWP